MPETYKGPTPPVGEKINPGQADQNRTPGHDQQQPQPNENLQNQPYSSKKTLDQGNQQHQWNDTDPAEGVSEGVSEQHASPTQPKHGRSADATSKSSTGQPQGENPDDTPPSAKN